MSQAKCKTAHAYAGGGRDQASDLSRVLYGAAPVHACVLHIQMVCLTVDGQKSQTPAQDPTTLACNPRTPYFNVGRTYDASPGFDLFCPEPMGVNGEANQQH